jgi:CheY-like chemotaxis protein
MLRTLRHHTVEHAVSGAAALEALSRDRAFDVILCDLMMPGLTGMDVYEAIATRWPELLGRLVFVTGGAVTAKARAFLASVSNPRYEKPLEPEQLEAVVQRFGDER